MVYLPKRWVIKTPDLNLVDDIVNNLNISRNVAKVIVNRGINSVKEAIDFYNPNLFHLQEPFLLPDMYKAVDRLRKAIDNNERILIYGDRDVDGVTATSIVDYTLKSLGNVPLYFIPSEEGYGLHKSIIEQHIGKIDLILTVDCGITASEEVKYAKENGIDVIITDHHEIPSNFNYIPDAIAVINPKRQDCKYEFKELAGCTVAFKLMQGLMLSYEENYNNQNMRQVWSRRMEFFLKDHLDLLTLGIIGDSMPLISENRTIVKYGLQLFKSSRKPGIKLLVEHLFRYKDTIMTKDISINIIPILNACGRLEQGKLAVEFLTTDNFIQAEKLLNKILQINDDRRILQSTYMDTIMQIINEQCNIEADKIFIITMKEIEQGISGILATQIAHQYHRLVIILNIIGTETIGTCRSIENFNIYKIIEKCSDILIKYGGHKQAAGFTLKTEYIDEFKKRVNEIINKELSIEELIPTIEIDGELKPEEVNIELVKELAVLEPYGNLNPYPIFMLRNIKIEEFSKQSQTSKNIKFKLKLNNNFITAVGLGLGYGPEQGLMRIPKYADLVIQMQINTWQNKDYLQLFIIDLKPTV